MGEEKKTFLGWIKKHKKELIIAGFSLVTIIAIIILIKNHKSLDELWSYLKSKIEKKTDDIELSDDLVSEMKESDFESINRIPHSVSNHLRNLPEGWNASAEKIATAAEQGYELRVGQTWVAGYRTGQRSA